MRPSASALRGGGWGGSSDELPARASAAVEVKVARDPEQVTGGRGGGGTSKRPATGRVVYGWGLNLLFFQVQNALTKENLTEYDRLQNEFGEESEEVEEGSGCDRRRDLSRA